MTLTNCVCMCVCVCVLPHVEAVRGDVMKAGGRRGGVGYPRRLEGRVRQTADDARLKT